MNESTKTSVFLALAVALVAVAFFSRPVVREVKPDEMIGKALFPKFDDPLKVKKLEIVREDAAGDAVDFRVADIDGVWSIPSHDNYPADAKDQMGKVAEALVDLKVLDVVAMNEATDKTTLYTMYGVVDPSSDSASIGEGIGVKVKLTGADEEPLVDLIVGKEADQKEKKNAEDPDEAGKLRYVRVPGQSPVYVVEIDPKRFSTNFDQWIEKNLLDISTLDLKEVFVDEYSSKIETELARTAGGMVPQPKLIPTFIGDFLLAYNGSGTGADKWKLEKLMGFRGRNSREYYAMEMKPDEELNTEVLDTMVSALNDLKIVGVTKKPATLAETLKAGKALETIKGDASLQKAGFYLVPMPDLKGGTTKTRKQLLSSEGDLQLRMKDGIRYNLRFGDLTGTESEIDAAKDESKPDEKDASEKPKPETTMGVNRYLFISADFDPSVIPAADIQSPKPLQEVPAEGAADDIAKIKAENEKIVEENKQIDKSNQREQDRVKEATEAGKKRAEKLTERFADWYYVIPEDVYKKVHLSRTNIIREKKKEEAHDHAHDGEDDHGPGIGKPSAPKFPTLPGMDGMLKVPGLEGKPEKAPGVVDWPEEPKPETPKTEPAKVEEPKPEPPKTEETKPDDKPKPETKPAEEMKPAEEAKPAEEPKPEAKPAEESKPAEAPKPVEEKKAEEKKPDEPKEEKKDDKPFDPFGGDAPK